MKPHHHLSPRGVSDRILRSARSEHAVPTALEWVEDATGRCARVTVIGNRSVLVENHTGILTFSDEIVRLNTAGGALCVSGRNLALWEARPGTLIVRGFLRRVDLPCKGGDAPDEG